MAFYALGMLAIALELAPDRPAYEDIASKLYEHFLYIADAMNRSGARRLVFGTTTTSSIMTSWRCRGASRSRSKCAPWSASSRSWRSSRSNRTRWSDSPPLLGAWNGSSAIAAICGKTSPAWKRPESGLDGCSPSSGRLVYARFWRRCSTKTSSSRRSASGRFRKRIGTIRTCSRPAGESIASPTNRPNRPAVCSAAIPIGAARCGFHSTIC